MNKFSNTAYCYDLEPDGDGASGKSGPYKSRFIRRAHIADAPFDVTHTECNRHLDEDGEPIYVFECPTKETASALCALLNVSEALLEWAPQLLETLELGAQMRAAQNTYFRDRSKDNLIASKQLEAKFDKTTRELLARVEGESA